MQEKWKVLKKVVKEAIKEFGQQVTWVEVNALLRYEQYLFSLEEVKEAIGLLVPDVPKYVKVDPYRSKIEPDSDLHIILKDNKVYDKYTDPLRETVKGFLDKRVPVSKVRDYFRPEESNNLTKKPSFNKDSSKIKAGEDIVATLYLEEDDPVNISPRKSTNLEDLIKNVTDEMFSDNIEVIFRLPRGKDSVYTLDFSLMPDDIWVIRKNRRIKLHRFWTNVVKEGRNIRELLYRGHLVLKLTINDTFAYYVDALRPTRMSKFERDLLQEVEEDLKNFEAGVREAFKKEQK